MSHLTSEILNLYLDAQLDTDARIEAHAHLTTCAYCQRELDELRGVFTALDALEPERIPVDLAPRVLERVAPLRSWAGSPFALGLLVAQFALAGWLAVLVLPALLAQPLTNLFALPNPPLIEPPTFLLNSHDALAFALQDWMASLARLNSFPDIGTMQWLIAIGGIGIVWLVSNRVLLFPRSGSPTNLNDSQRTKPEGV